MALKGDGRWNSHWFIACYAQNTPTQTKPFYICVGRKSHLSAIIIATAPEIRPQSYLRFAFQTVRKGPYMSSSYQVGKTWMHGRLTTKIQMYYINYIISMSMI